MTSKKHSDGSKKQLRIIDSLMVLGIDEARILRDEPLSAHTSFKIGGPADCMVIVNDTNELARVLLLLSERQEEHMLIGNGSNLLFSDNGYRGVIVKLGGEFEKIEIVGNRVRAGAAALLSRVSKAAADLGLAGMEFASGIPGSIGGAVFMNAGAYGGEMKDVVKSVSLMPPQGGELQEVTGEDLKFAYRYSALQECGCIACRVELELNRDDADAIHDRMRELTDKRNSKQPVNYPSAGSTFKRPLGGYAAALIEEAGLKGTSIGGAQVSDKHSGFIINTGGATCQEVLALMRLVRETVYKRSGIMLEPEVRIIGEIL